MNIAQTLLIVGAGIMLMLGIGHGVLTLLDTFRARYFTPIDDTVRLAMEGVKRLGMQRGLPVGSKGNMWRAWLGFNLSHSLGIIITSSILLILALRHFAIFAESGFTQCAVLGVTAVYLIISIRFWFWLPSVGFSVALICLVGAAMLA